MGLFALRGAASVERNDADAILAATTELMQTIMDRNDLVPDQGHAFVTDGYGTFGQPDYVTAAQAPDGGLAIAYVPAARTITVSMATMAGSTTARWYDPASGSFRPLDPGELDTVRALARSAQRARARARDGEPEEPPAVH